MMSPRGPSPHSPLGRLLNAPTRPGTLVWIGLRPARHAPMVQPTFATLVAQTGIEGDRYKTTRDGERQVTLIASEQIASIASFLGRDVSAIPPELLRRNLLTRGINLAILKNRRFRIGATLLCGAGDCAPCSQMEQALGPGGYNAVRGHGGITARILEGGVIRIGDAVTVVDADA